MKKIIYIVGYEGADRLNPSSFEWYYDDFEAKKIYNQMLGDEDLMRGGNTALYGGELEVDTTDPNEITSEVEKFLIKYGCKSPFITKKGNFSEPNSYKII